MSGYSRKLFGPAERYEKMRPALYARDVVYGREPYGGSDVASPSVCQVEHIVPLEWLWRWGIDPARREEAAADPLNLTVTTAHWNEQKGDRPPGEWMPPNNKGWYALRWLAVCNRYGLTRALTNDDRRALDEAITPAGP